MNYKKNNFWTLSFRNGDFGTWLIILLYTTFHETYLHSLKIIVEYPSSNFVSLLLEIAFNNFLSIPFQLPNIIIMLWIMIPQRCQTLNILWIQPSIHSSSIISTVLYFMAMVLVIWWLCFELPLHHFLRHFIYQLKNVSLEESNCWCYLWLLLSCW